MTEPLNIVCPSCSVLNRVPEPRLSDIPKCGRCGDQLFSGSVLALTSANFNKQINRNDIPIVVDFWAPWCGPCKAMAPAYLQAVSQLEPKVRLAKLNTEAEQMLAGQHRIQSIPTLVMFSNGKEVARQAGAMAATDIVNWVKGKL
ncbi:MAG: thioredoxin TrxC [Pseudomonadales bacterium]|nr:thioredoxin TrxC [Pseudomonadales bacterium]